MNTNSTTPLKDGDQCMVVDRTRKGKSGKVSDLHISKTGHTTITVKQNNAVRFKTLRKNVLLKEK